MQTSTSQSLFAKAQQLMPGGVNSPVRACGSVGGEPVFIEKGKGSKLYDADGNEYIDYVLSWGPLILGHCPDEVTTALKQVIENGTSFGAPTKLETELAGLITQIVPSVEKVRMVNSGTEATMSAIRLARGFTGRDLIVKFDGCYHGHADTLLVAAGSGIATLGIPGSPGVPDAVVSQTLSLKYNDIDGFVQLMKEKGDQIACVILEPVAGNMGFVPPVKDFLETLREQTSQYGSLLIFDEVMTGFRVAKDCAQGLFNIKPDLTCFGKVIGGGLPVGAYGGRKDVMDYIAPKGPVYQAGTLSGNPLAMASGIAMLTRLQQEGTYEQLSRHAARFVEGLKSAAQENRIALQAQSIGSMMGFFFNENPVNDFEQAKTCNLDRFSKFYREMLKKGIYLAPSQFEAGFVSLAHTDADIDKTIAAADEVMRML